MADSDITVSDLTATGGIAQIALTWALDDPNTPDGLPYLQLDMVEVWAASSNDRGLASLVGEGVNGFLHTGLTRGASYYYWTIPRNQSGGYGEWFPSDANSGVLGTETNSNLLLQSPNDGPGYFVNTNGLIEQWGIASVEAADGVLQVTFPMEFPNSFLGLSLTPYALSDGPGVYIPITANIVALNNEYFQVVLYKIEDGGVVSPVTYSVFWEAKGY